MTWWDAETLARSGTAVRKPAWPASRSLVLSAGKGTTRAVMVIREAGAERPIRSGDLGVVGNDGYRLDPLLMLDSRYKAPWRRLLTGANPTIGELFALAGSNAATIGWCGGSQAVPGFVRLAGSSAPVTAWGAAALAATRLERKNGRVVGNLARGIVTGLPQPASAQPARTQSTRYDISLGATPSALAGVVRSGSITNPYSSPASVLITSSGLARYLTINGSRVSYSAGSFDRVEITRTLGVGESLNWALVSDGTWAGGDVSFVVYGPTTPAVPAGNALAQTEANASAAIPALDLVVTVPWFPYGESFARAGTWVRREYWTDLTRKVRFENGLGSAPAVLVETVGPDRRPIRAGSFELAEFLGDDWRPFSGETADALLVDVTDFRFERSGLTGFFLRRRCRRKLHR